MSDTNTPTPEQPTLPAEPAAPSGPSSPAPQRASEPQSSQGTAVAERPRPSVPPPSLDKLPPFKVLLHNDDHNDQIHVTRSLIEVASMSVERAFLVMMEAHNTGVGLVCVTHKELAELKREQLQSKGLTATIEADA